MRSLIWLALVGCSEYDLHQPTDEDPLGQACEGQDPVVAVDVPLNDSCAIDQQTGTFTPVVEWTLPGNQAYGPPIVGQLNDDNNDGSIDAADEPDVLFQTTAGYLVSVNGISGQLQWSVYSGGYGGESVAIGDLDADGVPEIVAPSSGTMIALYDNEGNQLWTQAHSWGPLGYSDYIYPSVADLDGDGFGEIIAGSSIYSHDGRSGPYPSDQSHAVCS